MFPRTVLVTGANRGLGYEFVKQLSAVSPLVIAACRDPQKATVTFSKFYVKNASRKAVMFGGTAGIALRNSATMIKER